MKINRYSTLVILLLLVFQELTQPLRAQISFGGTPLSLGSNFKSLGTSEQNLQPVILTPINLEKINQEDAQNDFGNRFAIPISVNFNLQNSGKWTDLPNGDRLWRLKIHSEGAISLHLIFDRYHLPEGARLFLYDESYRTILGAFTSQNNQKSGRFGTDLIPAATLTIEYYEPAKVKGQGEISISRVNHGYKRIFLQKNSQVRKSSHGTLGFKDSDACNININCSQGDDWQDEKRGVALIVLNDINGSDWCSGSLINNTAFDGRPLLLTADHCEDGGGQEFIDTWIFVFNYEASDCNTPPDAPVRSQSIAGATILAKSAKSDFQLLELSSNIPFSYNAYFNGWDRSPGNHQGTVGIHHPSGDIKKISMDTDSTRTTARESNISDVNGDFYRVRWDEGTTEGGSSGSPLFNNSGRIIGQLYGGTASCSNSTQPDWFGKISSSWTGEGSEDTQLSVWLDPANSNAQTLEGYEPLANDMAVSSLRITVNPCDYSQNTPVEVTLRNSGRNDQGAFVVKYALKKADNTIISSGSQSFVGLGSGDLEVFTLGIDLTELEDELRLEVFLDNFSDDNNANNFRMLDIENILLTKISVFPYAEDFESDAGNWTVKRDNSISPSWQLGEPEGTVIDQAFSGTQAWVTNLSGVYANNESSYLLSPFFDFSNRTRLSLRAGIFVNSEEDYDGLQIQVSRDCGLTWERLGEIGTGINWYNNESPNLPFEEFGNFAWSGTDDTTWRIVEHSLEAYANEKNILIRVLFRSDFSGVAEGFGFDNFSIFDLDDPVPDKLDFILYPNPTQDKFRLLFNKNLPFDQPYEITLFSSLGKEISRFVRNYAGANPEFSLDGMPPGVYLIRLKTDEGSVTKKFIKI
ncbi:MAG: T9SS type A sorting domain-containing protein [Microscillaceae bacterium]|nr:T9SS type A sorting domain-containing protein [Microscillaceae bacterium]